jgi:16S rRNA (cytidine1402-2'-O)-methyltransferase
MPEARPDLNERCASGHRASAGTLYVVATPIGNLEDITLRALNTLKSVGLVAAEDTRRTGNLLRHFGIHVHVLSVHEHNERGRIGTIAARLTNGESVALVTDAGTPAVSDPGASLVAAIRNAGFRVEPIPGPSAVATAISASGISTDGFVFLGFPPIRGKDRNKWFMALLDGAKERAVVFFEAPHRLTKTLIELAKSVKQPIFMAREITKTHEEFVWGTPAELATQFGSPKGEFTLIVPPLPDPGASAERPTDDLIMAIFGEMTEKCRPGSRRDTIRHVAERLGLTTRDVYDALERVKIGQTTE